MKRMNTKQREEVIELFKSIFTKNNPLWLLSENQILWIDYSIDDIENYFEDDEE